MGYHLAKGGSALVFRTVRRQLCQGAASHHDRNNVATGVPSGFRFVPKHREVSRKDVEALENFLAASVHVGGGRGGLLVVTGAGVSTESGLPDYRSDGVGLYAKKDHKVTQHRTFVESAAARKSYWARNFVGWPRWSTVKPNQGHVALARWERTTNLLNHVITQNVDQLHFKAGSTRVVELHGTNSAVACLTCKYSVPRMALQEVMTKDNPELALRPPEETLRPDGDVYLTPDQVANFNLPRCPKCSGDSLKPIIVFFGDNVPKDRVEQCRSLVSECRSILVLGSSLQVFSSYRLLLQAREEGKAIGIINIGDTRADHMELALRIRGVRVGDVLSKVRLPSSSP